MKNIRDLSKITGYSISTISRYMNNSGYVSERAANVIKKAIAEENYHVNNLARTVFTKQSNLIGCILKQMHNPFYVDFIEALDNELGKSGYQLIISYTHGDSQKEQDVINNLINLRVDGIFILNGNLDCEFYENAPVNIIAINRFLTPNIPFISTNDELVGTHAADYMKSLGVKNPAYIDINEPSDVSHFRLKGFNNSFGGKVPTYICSDNYKDVANMIVENDHDGVFFYNDYIAIPTNNYLQKLNDEIIVVSCDRVENLRSLAPNIYSIEHDLSTIINTAINIVNNKEESLIHKIPPLV